MKKVDRALDISMIEEHRFDDCLFYNFCLAVAARKMWNSFSCRGCPDYVPAPQEDDEPSTTRSMEWVDRAQLLI